VEFLGGRVSPRRKGHPSSCELQVMYDSAVGPFAQARDAAQQEEDEERADSTWKK
jgi:hypothetical protein